MRTSSERGFTLLEIMVTLALVGTAVIPMLLIRERAARQHHQARHANVARMLARQLLSEVEFRGVDQNSGDFDGYPGFHYELEVEEVDLVTGDEEDEEEDEPGSPNYNGPGDAIFPEEEDDGEYPVRRVSLTIFYPNLKNTEADEPLKLEIQTIFDRLPDEDDDDV